MVIHTKDCGTGNMRTLRHGDMSMGEAAQEVDKHHGETVDITFGKLGFFYPTRFVDDIDIDFTK